MLQKPNSTKEQIIQILSNKWPISVKELHKELEKEFNAKLTYQAVHKTISEMIENKILENENKKLQLNKKWLESQKKFFDTTESKYSGKHENYILDPYNYEPQKFEFDNISKFCVTMAHWINDICLKDKGDQIGIGILRHLWSPTSLRFVDLDLLKKMGKVNKTYMIIKFNSNLDRWLKKQYDNVSLGPIKLGVNHEYEDDFAVRNSYVIQVHFSDETKKIMDSYYKNVKDIKDLLKYYIFQKIPKEKIKITVTVYRNRDMANLLKKQAISYFEAKE